jgi:hypothetical protein
MNHLPKKPLKITVWSFRIFSKIRDDIHKSAPVSGINDTVGKFATGVNNTGGKNLKQYQTVDTLK